MVELLTNFWLAINVNYAIYSLCILLDSLFSYVTEHSRSEHNRRPIDFCLEKNKCEA